MAVRWRRGARARNQIWPLVARWYRQTRATWAGCGEMKEHIEKALGHRGSGLPSGNEARGHREKARGDRQYGLDLVSSRRKNAIAYCTAKDSILARALAMDLAPDKIRVNAVLPINVGVLVGAIESIGAQCFDDIPLGRMGQP